jgi:hypothetical protein
MNEAPAKVHAVRRPWTAEEDIKLCEAITLHGSRQWKQICLSVPSRDHIQCLQRWQKVLDPSLRKGFWSPEEDALLVRLKVAADAAVPPGRGACRKIALAPRHCRRRRRRRAPATCARAPSPLGPHVALAAASSAPAHRALLLPLPRPAVPSWGCISKSIIGRNPKQCRERWNNFLDPSLNMGPWTPEEDTLLREGWGRYGSSWSTIAKLLQGRTQTKIRDRWKYLSSRNAHKRRAAEQGQEGALDAPDAAAALPAGRPQRQSRRQKEPRTQPSPPPQQQQQQQQQKQKQPQQASSPTVAGTRKRKAVMDPSTDDGPVTPRFSDSRGLASRRAFSASFSAAQDPSMSPPLDALPSAAQERQVPRLSRGKVGGRRGRGGGAAGADSGGADALGGAAFPQKYSARTADTPDEATATERRLRVQAAAAAMHSHLSKRGEGSGDACAPPRGKAKKHATWLHPRSSSRAGAAAPKSGGARGAKSAAASRSRAPPPPRRRTLPPLSQGASRSQDRQRRPCLELPGFDELGQAGEHAPAPHRPTTALLHIDPHEFGLPALRSVSPDSSTEGSDGEGGAFSQLCIGLAADSFVDQAALPADMRAVVPDVSDFLGEAALWYDHA